MSSGQENVTLPFGTKPCLNCQRPISLWRKNFLYCTRDACERARDHGKYRLLNPVNECENCGEKCKKKGARFCNKKECQKKAIKTREKERKAERAKATALKTDETTRTENDNNTNNMMEREEDQQGSESSSPNSNQGIFIDETPLEWGRYQSYAGDENDYDEWEPYMNSGL